MTHSFIAYIDESGDDGLTGKYRVVGQRGGSSHWLTLSASVWRFGRDLEATEWVREIREKFPDSHQSKSIHCQKLSHNQRVATAQVLAKKPVRSICIMAHKPSLDTGTFSGRNLLYFYLCRFLLERLSWLCRDSRKSIREGDGRVKIVFSRRGKMSYDHFKEYLKRLKQDPEVSINWGIIDIEGIEARDHATRAGLQISDIIATCITAGLEHDLYGNCEVRYADILKPIIYQHGGRFLSYGIKVMPSLEKIALSEQQCVFIKKFE